MATEQQTEMIESPPALSGGVVGWLRDLFWVRAAGTDADESSEGISPGEWVSYGLLILVAAVMRLWDLGSRALHHDESLHSYFSWELFDGRGFVHNPMMHGPLQFEANAAIFFALGDSDYTSRLLYAVMGTILVVIPILFRKRLGKLGALLVSAMLVFSPAMLYFSRFARNDILMAVWTLGLVVCMWRYIDEGKNRYVYAAAGLLALAFTTKETSYLITVILGMFLFVIATPEHWRKVRDALEVTVGETSPPSALWQLGTGIWGYISHGMRLSEFGRAASFLLVLITLTLPQWSAAVSIFQNTPLLSWSNLTLANPDTANPIGAASGGGLVIAFGVVVAMLAISVFIGFQWRWGVWWRSAVIFYAIWALLYSTFFTNLDGIGSGVWQGLGYWIAQQDVARGNQPWYYYLVITPVYEFLPLLFGLIAAVYYTRRKDVFGRFLAYWVVATLILYTIASEKMPWLLVNISLPLIVISGKFLGETIPRIQWRKTIPALWISLLIGVPLTFVLLWRLALFGVGDNADSGLPLLAGLSTVILLLLGGGVFMAYRVGRANFLAFSTIPVFLLLMAFSIRTGWTASFKNGDTPLEMIVYTQTSPDVTQLMREIQAAGAASGEQLDMSITIDQTSGFTWPWAWYLRDYTQVNYPSYESGELEEAPDSPVVVVHSNNQAGVHDTLTPMYENAELIKHRWWFPESTYRDVTVKKFFKAVVDRESWRRVMDYWLYRKGVSDRIGSEDAYLYVQPDFPRTPSPNDGS
ncbi:MAG: TIGR03663 family protein [Chloroflexi bacterium]|nr:TIGR03663 family protein [Chloroflexota bacterium]MDA1228520.1 TIGR03663 family protein [Chloroflexota bacterium]